MHWTDGNKHLAPPMFRQFVSPNVFGVMKKNRGNKVKIEKLRKRLSISGGSLLWIAFFACEVSSQKVSICCPCQIFVVLCTHGVS